MSSTKPTIVFTPGAWHTPEIYNATIDHLAKSSYPSIKVSLPSVGAKTQLTNFDPDVNAIRTCLTQLVEVEGKEVILVMHSYSGVPGSEAPRGLGIKERQEKGLKGGVIRLVYVMAWVPLEGICPTAGGEYPEWMKYDSEKGVVTVTPEDAKRIFYHDLPDAEASAWVAKLLPQRPGVFTSANTYAAWRYIPSTFVFGTLDRSAFSREAVDAMLEAARKVEPSACDVVEEVEAGHCLMVSKAEWFAGVLRRAAGEA